MKEFKTMVLRKEFLKLSNEVYETKNYDLEQIFKLIVEARELLYKTIDYNTTKEELVNILNDINRGNGERKELFINSRNEMQRIICGEIEKIDLA